MKHLKKIFSVFLVLLVIITVGCKKSEFKNTNPNDVTASTIDYKTVLPSSLNRQVGTIASDYRFLQFWMGFWARSGSFQQVKEEETYDFTNAFNAQIWNNNYGIATNFDFVINKAKENGAAKYEGIARIMKAQNIQTLVDVYGDIPYFQAFKGNDNRTPKYDKGKDIYVDLFRQLDTAIALMKSSAASNLVANLDIAANDLAFKGNSASWIKYANTLKLRMLIHVFQVPGFDISGEMAKINAEGSGYIDAGTEAAVNPGYTASKPNPYYRSSVRTEAGVLAGNYNFAKANKYAVGTNNDGYYQLRNDTRVDRFYVKPLNGVIPATSHRGIAFGDLTSNPANNGDKLSTIDGPGLVPDGPASRAWLITASESYFLQAEARQRNIITSGSSPDQLLTLGIQQSFRFLGLTIADANFYIARNSFRTGIPANPPTPATPDTLANPDVVITAGFDPLFTILSQKWFALNSIAVLEVWTDYRRTDIIYGKGIPPTTNLNLYLPGPPISINPANISTKIPVRLFYPQSEFSYNAANVAAQGNIDRYTSRVFWDIN